MIDANSLGIAIAAIIFGGLLLSLVYLSAQLTSRERAPAIDSSPAVPSALGNVNDAVLVARRGGKIIYANNRAKLMFSSGDEVPSLNRMARMAQPPDALYDLFAAEGQVTLTVGNRPLEATSMRLPGELSQFMVTLRENTQLEKLRDSDNSAQAIAAIGEVSKTLFSSLDLNIVTNNTLQIIERVIQFDIAEINLWDSQAQVIRPYARSGDRAYTIVLNQKATAYHLDEGCTGWIARNKSPLLIGDVERRLDVQPKLKSNDFPVRSIVGVPLLYGTERELVGTLEIASIELDRFQPQDVQLLETIASQAVIAIRNAQYFAQQQTRVAELSGLAQVAQTASALANSRELNANLTGRIASLMGVQLCGILLHSESERALISQAPFYGGVPDAFLEMYRIPLTPNSRAEHIWSDEEFWYTNDVLNDPLVAEAGLTQLAETVGVKMTLLAPLKVGNTRLGVVQVSNKIGGAPFGDDDARLLQIYAGQAAILIDNARLVRESEERVKRAEAIRLIAEITGSRRPLEEIYREVMKRIAELLPVDFGIVLLLDEAKGELLPQRGSEIGADFSKAEAVHVRSDDPSFLLSVTTLRKPFYTWRASRDRRITPMYKRMVEYYRVESAIIAPLIVQDKGLGEVLLGSRRERAFARSDMNLVETIAAQLASAIERDRLASITDVTLRRRVEQLTALTRLGRELNQTLEIEHILQSVHDEAIRATHADCGSIFLLDTNAVVLRASMRIGCHYHDDNHQLDSLEMNVALSGTSQMIHDLTSSEVLANLTTTEDQMPSAAHDGIRSLIAVPLLSQGVTVGVIEVHSSRPNSFDQVMFDFLQILSAQAAVAVSNTQRYAEQLQRGDLLRRRADQLSQLLQISRTVRSDNPLEANLEAIAFGVQEAIGYNKVLISVLDAETNLVHRLAAAGVPLATLETLKGIPQPWAIYASSFKPEFRISQSYYIPHDQTPAELRQSGVRTTSSSWEGAGYWHDEDYFFVPLIGSGGQFVGIMSLDDPQDRRAPDRSTVETIEIFANQAALAIENARLFQAAENQAAKSSKSLEELQKSYRDLDAVSRILARKDHELGALIGQTDVRAKRLLALHRIASSAAEIRDEHAMLQRVAEATVSEMSVEIFLIGLIDRSAIRIVAAGGAVANFSELDSLLTSLNPMSQVVELHTPLLDRECSPHGWGASQLIKFLGLRSFISVPITVARTISGAVLIGSQQEVAPFSNEDIDLFTILGNQIGAGIENIRLYEDQTTIAEENARLYGETRELQEFSESVFESLQQGVIVLDADNRVLSINGWMRQTFGWPDALIGNSLFEFRPLYRDLGLDDSIQRAIYNGQPIDRLIVRDTNPQGSPLVTNFYGYPLRRDGMVSGVVLLVEDVTAQARLEADVRERATQLQALAESARVVSSALRREEVIALTLEQLQRVIPYDTATLWLREGDLLRVEGARGFDKNDAQIGLVVEVQDSLLFKELSATGKAISVPDVRNDERFPAGIISRTRSWLGAPLIAKGQSLGLIALDKVEADFYSTHHVELAIAFATQTAIALDNARLFEDSVQRAFDLDERSQRLALLNRISSSLSTSLDVHRILEIAAREMSNAMSSARVLAIMHDDDNDISSIAIIYPHLTDLPAAQPLAGNPLVERVRETLSPVIIDDVARSDLLLQPTADYLLGIGTKALLVVPLIAGGGLLGTLNIDPGKQEHFKAGEIELAQTIANQTAIAIENSRLYTESRKRSAELGMLFELGVSVTQELDIDRVMSLLFEKVQQLLTVDTIAVTTVIDDKTMRVEGVEHGERFDPLILPRTSLTSTEMVLKSGEPMLIGGTSHSQPNLPTPIDVKEFENRTWFGVPLTAHGKTIGVLSMHNDRPVYFDQSDAQLLTQIGNQIAIAIENARLFATTQRYAADLEQRVAERTAELEKERDQVETLLRITNELSASLDLDRVLVRALSLVNDVIGGTQGGLFLLDPQSEQLIYRAALGTNFQLPSGGVPAPFRRGEGLVGWVIKNRQAIVVHDLMQDDRWIQRPLSEQHRSAICAPLLSSEDALGAMIFYSDVTHAFDDDQLRLVSAAATQVTSAINNAELYRLIRDQAERLGGMLRANQVEASKSQSILESVADGVLVADPEGKVILFNATAERILQLSRDEVLGRPANDFLGFYGGRAKNLTAAIQRWSEDPSSYQPGDLLAEQIELEDKRIISVLLTPVTSTDEFLGSVSIFRDITREVEVDRIKTEFVTTASHELLTPITPIKGYADLLLMGAAGALTPGQQQAVELIKSNADRLRSLVDDLLDISRIESGKIEMQFAPVPIHEVIAEVVTHLQERVSTQKPMQIVNNIPDDLPRVSADRARLIQIITNLADNAFSYTEAGGTITLEAHLEDGGMVVSVRDTGIGLTPEDKARMFERFYRAENPLVMASAGTGLGLSIVQRLVDMHEGKLWAESDGIGCGSTFYVQLKLATPEMEMVA